MPEGTESERQAAEKRRQSKLPNLVDELREEERNLSEIVSELREEIEKYESDLGRVQGALKALGQSTSKGKKKGGGKPAPSKAVVEETVNRLRSERHGIGEEELKGAVESHLVENGYSRSGLALRLKEVLSQSPSESA